MLVAKSEDKSNDQNQISKRSLRRSDDMSFLKFSLTLLMMVFLTGCLKAPVMKDSPGQLTYVADINGRYKIMVMGADGNAIQMTQDALSENQPTWSPDGKMVAFMSPANHISKMNADGTGKVQLTSGSGQDSDPAWSPDGTRIAFVSSRDGKSEIYLMNPDGSDLFRVANNTTQNTNPSWSPDGEEIAFACAVRGASNICVIERNGTNLSILTNAGFNSSPSWSPDGKKIAFVFLESEDNLEIYTMNPDGTERINLTRSPGNDRSPAWSPDGKKIAFEVYNQPGIPASAYMSEEGKNIDIFEMNSDGSNQINVTQTGYYELTPAWRP
jgi:Tol biopolymer transport system component